MDRNIQLCYACTKPAIRIPRERHGSSILVTTHCRSTPFWMCAYVRFNGKTAACQTSDEFVDSLQEVIGLCRPKQDIGVIFDKLSTHKSQNLASFVQDHPNVTFHFTPTYSSLVNQVEIWLSRIGREVIAHGVFTRATLRLEMR